MRDDRPKQARILEVAASLFEHPNLHPVSLHPVSVTRSPKVVETSPYATSRERSLCVNFPYGAVATE
jgi:hypothetical protein